MNILFEGNVSLVYNSLQNLYCGIYIIDLQKASVSVINNYFKDKIIYTYAQLNEVINCFIHNVEDYKSVENELSLLSLTDFFDGGCSSKRIELSFDNGQKRYDYMEISIVACDKMGIDKKVIMFFKNINTQRLNSRFVKRHIYHNCEYLLIIDTIDNKFDLHRINQSDDLELIAIYNDYSALPLMLSELGMIDNSVDVIGKKLDIEQLKISLSVQKECNLYYDVKDCHGEYRRKKMQYFYDDQSDQKIMMSISDISDDYFFQKKQKELLSNALKDARTDFLTCLLNRKATEFTIKQKLCDTYPSKGLFNALMFVDIDNFKLLNDTIGHLEGDRILKYLGDHFNEMITCNDVAGRIGGDEFLLYFENLNETEIKKKAKKICEVFDDLKNQEDIAVNLTCSVGIALTPINGTKFEELLYEADVALYDAKRKGKKQYAFCKK